MQPNDGKAEPGLDAGQLETVLQSAADGITVMDVHGRLVFANDAAARLIGFASAEALLAAPLEEVRARFEVTDERGEPLPADRWPGQSVLDGESLAEAVLRYRRRDTGEERWSLVRAAPIRDAGGEVQFEVTVAQDITALKQGEARLRVLADTSALLASSLDYDATLAEVARLAVPEFGDWAAVDVVGEDGGIEQLAVSHMDPVASAWAKARLHPTGPEGETMGGVPAVIRTGKPAFYPAIADDLLPVDGTEIAAVSGFRAALVVPLRARQRILGAITFLKSGAGPHFSAADLTFAEQLAARAALALDNARLYRQAQDALHVRDEVLASISHDLRTPLTTIKGMASLLMKRLASGTPPDADVVLERLGLVSRAATQMQGMIGDVVDLSRLEAGRRIDLDLQEVDLVPLVQHLADEYQGQSTSHRLRFETELRVLIGVWDSARLERVLINLLSNAVKYSPDGGAITMSISQELGDGATAWARIGIRDEGVGIPGAELTRIFERFYRGSNVIGSIRGVGIGLTGAKGIVEQHGGRLELESEEGRGTLATVWLPLEGPAVG